MAKAGVESVDEITPKAERDSESAWLAASWEAPRGAGGITTPGEDLGDPQHQIM